ncbi:MAG: TetR/AcrR family transcriptional regulator [Balneola sp.]|nr:MAG: TetR/AcrR family transcriptional regulator [Balneola sp.]
MSAEKINKKIEITWAAVELYEAKQKLSIPDLVDKTGLSASEIYSYFPNKNAILSFYYPALIYQYWAMIEEIEDFESYSISEKFSNFIYTLFDMLTDEGGFADDTYHKFVFSKGSRSEFHKEVSALFKDFLTSDGNIAVSAGFFMKDYFYSLLTSQYLFLVKFWLNDKSDQKENTLALVDKLTSLFEETIYNKAIDKGFDLAKYMFGTIGMGDNIPLFGDCLKDMFSDNKSEVTDNE